MSKFTMGLSVPMSAEQLASLGVSIAKTSHPVTRFAVANDIKLAEAIAMVHCDVDDFGRWNRAFSLLRSIRDEGRQEAAVEVLTDWAIPNTGSVNP